MIHDGGIGAPELDQDPADSAERGGDLGPSVVVAASRGLFAALAAGHQSAACAARSRG